MRGFVLFLLVLSLFFFTTLVIAEDDEKIKVGPGMELLEIGAVRVIVPKGTLYEDKGSKVEIEGIGEYVGRRFLEMEQRFAALEAKQSSLREEIAELRKMIEEMEQEDLAVEENGPRIK